ncbi:hypothetical protein Sme01_28900 [Sphaerisporangium melleum]|uniref:HTH cro/C1-type domain-containing protein n=1 Tax=Sphaerisporangium melleum TaxID=321316 RepID=A0A917VHV1_9ACTN|nr:helix-turn-helix transcriptional regulator [Sphaerisporangium melleum]GGK84487.1 hypothetical protein GCM10007964_28670 [Sphaerisporangium melleum]GII70414.1 hypothetical protein Sme01_28900 [Sphaerisporangium melleum]
MSQTGEVERFAARLRMLKERSGMSFEVLAARTGISRSSLHRYCSGSKLPTGYGPVHAFGKACGASGEELRELHRLWAVADTARSARPEQEDDDPEIAAESPREAPEHTSRDAAEEQLRDAPEEPPGEPVDGRRRGSPRAVWAVAAAVVLVAAAVTVFVVLRPEGGLAGPVIVASTGATAATAQVTVFNIEGDCGKRKDRFPACSMGLAIDPRKKYAAGNVVSHRVWHGDVLVADCVLFDGDRVEDETGVGTSRWFRVRLDDVPEGHGWLPAVRTHDNPALPVCA